MTDFAKCSPFHGATEPQQLASLGEDKNLRRRIFELLGKPKRAKRQYFSPERGWAYPKLKSLAATTFYKHLRGQITVAVSPIAVVKGHSCATFLAWNIDDLFEQRLTVMREVLRERGMADAAWAVTGSASGRGKVILSFTAPIFHKEGIRLVKAVLEDCKRMMLWGNETEKSSSTFPQGGQGGTVRVLGRNQQRAAEGHVDRVLDLEGRFTDLAGVKPYSPPDVITPLSYAHIDNGINSAASSQRGGIIQRAELLFSTPYSGGGSTIFQDMGYVAKATVIQYGKGEDALRIFEERLDRLAAQVPDSKTDTHRQLREARGRAWAGACAYIQTIARAEKRPDLLGNWKPLTMDFRGIDGKKPRKGSWRVYNAATEFILRYRHNPRCFPIAYSHWATLANYDDPADCRHAVDNAEKLGMLFRIDRGLPGVKSGLLTLVTFVGDGETLQEAYDRGVRCELYHERVAELARRGLAPFGGMVTDNRPWFPPRRRDLIRAA